MDLYIRLTCKGESEETTFQLSEGKEDGLYLVPTMEGKPAIRLEQHQGELAISDKSLFEEKEEVIITGIAFAFYLLEPIRGWDADRGRWVAADSYHQEFHGG